MTGLDVVGLGLAMVDVVIRLDQMPRWDNPGHFSGFTLANGGPAGTACFVASSLGVPTGFIDTLGNDDIAARKLRSLEQAGVDTSQMIHLDAPENHMVIVYVHEQTGERVFSRLRTDTAWSMGPDDLDREYITAAQYLHLDSSHHGAALQAARWMHDAGKSVVLDASATSRPVPEQTRELVAETDVLICGSGFGMMLTGHDDLFDAGRALLALGPRVVEQTEGANGSYTVTGDTQFHTPAFDIDVIDTTGAGDVFHGAYLVGLVNNWAVERIANFASAVAAMHSTVLGNRNGLPRMDEVEVFLQDRAV